MVSTEQKALLEIVKVGLTDECLVSTAVFDADWEKLFDLACKQGVVCLAWHGLEILYKNGVDSCSADVKLQWYGRNKQVEAANKKMFGKVDAFADAVAPMKLVVLKGADYARYWNNPFWREFGDLDIIVADKDGFDRKHAEEFDRFAVERGCQYEPGDYKHTHLFYKNLMVENHYSFTEYGGVKEGVILEKELRKLFNNGCINLSNGLTSPNKEFTAVFMIAHVQNHFFYEGLSLRQILDWNFFLLKEGSDVDWSKVKPILEKTGLMTFAVLLTQFCNKHFGLQFDMGSSCSDELLEKFIDDVYADKCDDHDRRWWKMVERMIHRYSRFIKFRNLNKMSVASAIWKTLAYSSFLHRKPVL